MFLCLDLTKVDAPEKIFSFATQGEKRVEFLINVAGNGAYSPFPKTSLNEHRLTSLTKL
jgi:short-subunit dehydrogenase